MPGSPKWSLSLRFVSKLTPCIYQTAWAGYLSRYSDWATGWKVWESNPGGGEIFRTCPDRPWGPPSLLYNGYRVFHEGKERPGRDADPSPPFSAIGHEIVELYLYSPYRPYSLYRDSVPVQGWPLPFTSPIPSRIITFVWHRRHYLETIESIKNHKTNHIQHKYHWFAVLLLNICVVFLF